MGDEVMEELDEPKPGPRDVLIRVRACSLNYRDQAVVTGNYFGGKLPAGFRGAGLDDDRPALDGARNVERAFHRKMRPLVVERLHFRRIEEDAALGIAHDPHGHGISHDTSGNAIGTHAAHGPEPDRGRSRSRGGTPSSSEQEVTVVGKEHDIEAVLPKKPHGDLHNHDHGHLHGVLDESAATQIIGVAILEFGVVLHRCVSPNDSIPCTPD